jgi:NAD(P)-dependent dehydrogenase (short-subunit alcohol dehydrogenase family)
MLGEAGATVYCSGRSVSGHPATGTRPETIDETADLVTAAGGRGIAVQTDHLQADQVERLFARVKGEAGRLDVLVNDIWGGDHLTEWGTRFWKLDPAKGFAILDSAVRTHILTSRYGVPLMIEQRSGLVVEITDGDHGGYRGTLYYDLAKTAAIRLAFDMAQDLEGTGVTAVAVTPGFLRSEAMLERFGVTEATWRQAKVMNATCWARRTRSSTAAVPRARRSSSGSRPCTDCSRPTHATARWQRASKPSWACLRATTIRAARRGVYFAFVTVNSNGMPMKSPVNAILSGAAVPA